MSATVRIIPTNPHAPGLAFKLVGRDTLSGGAGGWSDVARPRRRAGVQWDGQPAYTCVLPLLLDGLRADGADRVVEQECEQLAKWGRPTRETGEPPIVRLLGPIKAPTSARWVISDIAWGDELRDRQELRVQQPVTVTLKQYFDVEVYRSPAERARAQS